MESSFAWLAVRGTARTMVESISSSGDRPLSLWPWVVLYLVPWLGVSLWGWGMGRGSGLHARRRGHVSRGGTTHHRQYLLYVFSLRSLSCFSLSLDFQCVKLSFKVKWVLQLIYASGGQILWSMQWFFVWPNFTCVTKHKAWCKYFSKFIFPRNKCSLRCLQCLFTKLNFLPLFSKNTESHFHIFLGGFEYKQIHLKAR